MRSGDFVFGFMKTFNPLPASLGQVLESKDEAYIMAALRCSHSVLCDRHQIGYIGGGSKVCGDIGVLGMEPLILLVTFGLDFVLMKHSSHPKGNKSLFLSQM